MDKVTKLKMAKDVKQGWDMVRTVGMGSTIHDTVERVHIYMNDDSSRYDFVVIHTVSNMFVYKPSDPILVSAEPHRWEQRQIDSWHDGEGWYDNQSFHVQDINLFPGEEKQFLLDLFWQDAQKDYEVEYDGSMYELVKKDTQEPLFRLIPVEG
jgi:hypothetical protein